MTHVNLEAPTAPQRSWQKWRDYKGTSLDRLSDGSAYLFQTSRMAVDADGAPNAYHPDNIGLDLNGNAGWPDKKWWPSVLVADPANPKVPFRQPSGEFAGYFVSKTRLEDPRLPETDPARYVDARRVPYLVFPGNFFKLDGTGLYGDLGVAVRRASGARTAFIVADQGPADHALGEVSIALAERLGGSNVNPRNAAGIPQGEVMYIVFPRSVKQRQRTWPLALVDLDRMAMDLLQAAGGLGAALARR